MRKVFLCKETAVGETRAALVPSDVKALTGVGCEIAAQSGVGLKAGYTDGDYAAAGAKIVQTLDEGYAFADIVVRVNRPGDIAGIRGGMVDATAGEAA